MFKALYDYNSSNAKYLSFKAGDLFTVINSTHKDWFLAQNGFGEVGYIPRNYIAHEDVALSEVLQSIDRAIEAIHYQTSAGTCTAQLRQNLQKLLQHRQNVVDEYNQRRASANQSTNIPNQANKKSSNTDHLTSQNSQICTQLTSPSSQSDSSKSDPTSSPTKGSDKKSSVRRKAPSPPCLSVTGNTPTGAQPGEITASDVITHTAEIPQDDIPNTGAFAEPGTSDKAGSSEPLEESQTSIRIDTSTDCLTVDTCSSISTSNKHPISPSRSQRSFPNSPSRQFDFPSVINVSSLPIPSHLGAGLADEVRRHTGLSHDKSCLAVEVVLSHVGGMIPQIASVMDKILCTFEEKSDLSDEDTGHDATRLQYLFSELASCKDDSQQRSWALHEDQQTIQGYLDELLSILENAKQSVCRRTVAKDSYDVLHNLVQYFQMETRVGLRLSLLQVFGALCSLEAVIISHLLYSVLPLELVSDLQNNSSDVRRLNYVALVLTMVTCSGESFPTSLEDHVNEEFIEFLLDSMESPPSPEHDDQVAESLVNLILALNLHYGDPTTNTIMCVIKRKPSLPVLTEKILMLFNRRDDPVKMFDHQMTSVHSVVKFLLDVFTNTETADLLYTNDAKVLVDILLRQLTDLQPGDQVRSSMLTLTQLVVMNSGYSDHKHRREELLKCMTHIAMEEGDTESDKEVATNMIQTLQNMA